MKGGPADRQRFRAFNSPPADVVFKPGVEIWITPTNEVERIQLAAVYREVEPRQFVVFHRSVAANGGDMLKREVADVRRWTGHLARIAILDPSRFGHIHVDDFQFLDADPTPGLIRANGALYDPDVPVWGFADTHTHPAANLGFGGDLISGSADGVPAVALHSCEASHGPGGANACVPLFFCAPSIIMERFTGSFGHLTGGWEWGFDGWPNVVE